MIKLLCQSLLALILLTLLTGVIYPLVVTAAAHACCSHQAEGSLRYRDGRLIGSELLGQPFDHDNYFWGRPSATSPQPDNALASGGSNLGPTNSAQLDAVRMRLATLQQADPANHDPVPVELVTASASGLDPDISPAAALYQLPRIARTRNLDPARVRSLITQHSQLRQWGVLGEPRVNVLDLNLALDQLH